jgi:hypothetical protein
LKDTREWIPMCIVLLMLLTFIAYGISDPPYQPE